MCGCGHINRGNLLFFGFEAVPNKRGNHMQTYAAGSLARRAFRCGNPELFPPSDDPQAPKGLFVSRLAG